VAFSPTNFSDRPLHPGERLVAYSSLTSWTICQSGDPAGWARLGWSSSITVRYSKEPRTLSSPTYVGPPRLSLLGFLSLPTNQPTSSSTSTSTKFLRHSLLWLLPFSFYCDCFAKNEILRKEMSACVKNIDTHVECKWLHIGRAK